LNVFESVQLWNAFNALTNG